MKITNSTRHIVLAAAMTLICPAAGAADQRVLVELNKLEANKKDACRAYMVMKNEGATRFETLKLDLVIFDADGIIAKRLAVEAAPLPVGKTSLKVFDINGLACARIGRLLLNNVIDCVDSTGRRGDCLALVSTRARGSVDFVK